MTEEELRNFRVLPRMVPMMLEMGGWLPEEIEALSEAEVAWYAAEANRLIDAHLMTLSQESRSPNSK